jgi:hypothetical protein
VKVAVLAEADALKVLAKDLERWSLVGIQRWITEAKRTKMELSWNEMLSSGWVSRINNNRRMSDEVNIDKK